MNRALRALAAAMTVLLLPLAPVVEAASCNGASHEAPQLTSGRASPGSGTTATSILLSVVYHDAAGCPPTSMTVTVDGVGTFELASSGGDPAAGITLSRTVRLPVGAHTYHFAASSGSGPGARSVSLTKVSPQQVTIAAPATTPAPTPAPPPPPPAPPPPTRGTPPPPPAPTPTPVPSASATPSREAAASQPGSSASQQSEPTADTGGSRPQPSTRDSGPMAGGVPPSSAPKPAAQKPQLILDLALAGPLGQYLIATTVGLLMFLLLVRRDGSMGEGATQFGMAPGLLSGSLAASHAAGLTGAEPRAAAGAGVATSPPAPVPVPFVAAGTPSGAIPADDGDEAGMPRWLRPSVRSARGIDPDQRHR